MRLVPTPVASQLTGLSTEKLREWTSRRALVPADVRPRQKGSPAQFSWQTILILRLALLLRDQFGVELQFHKENFAKLRKELRSASFIALWGRRLALTSQGELLLLDDQAPLPADDAIFICLDPHLSIIRDGFALPDAAAAIGQLDLFPISSVQAAERPLKVASGHERRRSA
ncbi:hypothetical protein PP715_21290 [Ralstonia solanacearum]|uniref:HTH merR-type domain-containing protein n=1 Tax=Ralstonia solanacearum (strain Po82) TaxID=1031711 RepID=F6G0I9_RALS8|nr:hypothetical protein [Ralstonia solanacearum]AEG68834.1 conserved hypothetical protein [Ralstonia solanacearum Po82]AMP70047.1 hypothetical protein UW163_11490 [Ralstonia solanacearum]MBB6587266.1 hypothetical protein [Ralstonia solanacearum]MCG3577541.1 hypothetical protein [Ralstonia solanacearum]MCL9842377.1 hypothetical protein [Ralstonia solanacearum]